MEDRVCIYGVVIILVLLVGYPVTAVYCGKKVLTSRISGLDKY